jgi:hypothetical protein
VQAAENKRLLDRVLEDSKRLMRQVSTADKPAAQWRAALHVLSGEHHLYTCESAPDRETELSWDNPKRNPAL